MNSSDIRILHQGKWLHLLEREDWQYAERANAKAVVGILPITNENKVVLVEQYRRPVQARVIEIPAGLFGDETEFANESLAECAKRELLEETGYAAGQIERLLSSPTSAGMTSEICHLFLATDLKKQHAGGGVGNEEILIHEIPVEEVDAWLIHMQTQGYLVDFKIQACLWAATEFFSE